MNKFQMTVMSASLNFHKWRTEWRIYIIVLGTLCFCNWNFGGFAQFGADYGLKVTAWVFPFMFTHPLMMIVYGYFTIMLFSDAPFMDGQTILWIARTGRLSWILGQLIYIVLSSLLYTIFLALAPILVLLSNVTFAPEWGKALYAIANDGMLYEKYSLAMSITPDMLARFEPVKAMTISMGMTWLCTMFMGGIMMCGNLLSGTYAGTIICSVFAIMTYFTRYAGPMLIGKITYWLTPVSYISMFDLDWLGYTGMPSPAYGITVLLAGIIVTFSASAFAFCKRDVAIRQGGILQ